MPFCTILRRFSAEDTHVLTTQEISMNRSLALVLMALAAAVGCGSTSDTSSDASNTSSNTSSNPPPDNPPAGATTLAASIDKDQTLSGEISMPQTTTIAAGVTLTLSAGAKILAADGAALVVAGTLAADGVAGTPVVFQSKTHGGAAEWTGIKLENGGNAKLTHAEIHDAKLAFAAAAGSSYALDYTLVDTSAQLASIAADGTITHSQLHGLGDAQVGAPFSVADASPQVTDTVIDKGKTGGVDLIVVNGASSSPLFDHVEVANAHCVFHFNAGKDIKITNSFIHDSAYGMMVTAATGLLVQGNNFQSDTTNIGTCTSGDVTSDGNYFGGGEAFDTNCASQTNTGTATEPLTGVGPRP
jgi:hypothetical protein